MARLREHTAPVAHVRGKDEDGDVMEVIVLRQGKEFCIHRYQPQYEEGAFDLAYHLYNDEWDTQVPRREFLTALRAAVRALDRGTEFAVSIQGLDDVAVSGRKLIVTAKCGSYHSLTAAEAASALAVLEALPASTF